MHWVACLRPACVIVGRHIGSGAAQWLLWEPLNIPKEIPEMAIQRKFNLLDGIARHRGIGHVLYGVRAELKQGTVVWLELFSC